MMIDYQSISKIIKHGLNFLEEYGYDTLTEEVERDNLTGDSLTLTYKSKEIGIEIGISYWWSQLGNPESFVVLIDNGNERIGLSEWLKKNGKNSTIVLWNDKNISEELFIKEFVSSFKVLCSGDLLDIIMGRRWDSIPIDFMGFK